MGNIEAERVHSVFSRAREGIEIEGVSDVISFDEGGVSLDTLCGNMAVEGEDLHVTVLDITSGRVVVEGKINGVYYFDSHTTAKKGFSLFGGSKRAER